MTSEHFHSKDKGCELEEIEERSLKHKELTTITPRRYFCKTHNIKVCHCGWEFGHHYEDNPFYSAPTLPYPKFKLKPQCGLTQDEAFAMQRAIDKGCNAVDILKAGNKCVTFQKRFLIPL